MSNENSSVNRPRSYIRRGCNPMSGRSRKFSLITYLDEGILKVILAKHREQVRVYAFAYHDMDRREDGTLKEPHIHLILVTYNACSVSAVRRWFSGLTDKNGLEITTTAQICSDVFSAYDYLTHSTREAREAGKYQYDKSIIRTNDVAGMSSYFGGYVESNFDTITLAAEDLLHGASVHDLGRRYGRDFILNFSRIKDYISAVRSFEKYGYTLDNILEREHELEIIKLSEEKF